MPLAIVVEREQKIRGFVPRDYWELIGTFQAKAGTYTGKWFDEKFVRSEKEGDPDLKPERFWELPKAEAIRARCLGKTGTVTEETKPSSQLSPLLYDLTSLQREANSRFGFSASGTLKLAQAQGLNLPLAAATKKQYDRMIAENLGGLDKSGIAELTFKGRNLKQSCG